MPAEGGGGARGGDGGTPGAGPIRALSAVSLAVTDMARSLAFYRALGFRLHAGGERAEFASLCAGTSFLNLQRIGGATEGADVLEPPARPVSPARPRGWGRVIFHVEDVEALHARALAAGYRPEDAPRDAGWGERYFHLVDPDGHELSFAKPLG